MAKVAFLFPGQGSQSVGMGRAASSEVESSRAIFQLADQTLGISVSRLCFEGPESDLQLTANAQPAILATSIALLRGLDARCDVVAGHSLGEYSANVAAGALAFEQAVALVRRRGEYMQDAVPVGRGAMAAVLGGDVAMVERVCKSTPGIVSPVNYNCPGQLVIAGETEAVASASAAIAAAGAKVRALPVSAPFHCELMRPAEDRLEPDLRAADWHEPIIPIYVNVDATAVTNSGAACEALVRQVSQPVRWQQIIERMLADGVGLFVEVGPGKVLTGMVRRIAKDAKRVNVETPSDFAAAREAIAAQR